MNALLPIEGARSLEFQLLASTRKHSCFSGGTNTLKHERFLFAAIEIQNYVPSGCETLYKLSYRHPRLTQYRGFNEKAIDLFLII